MAPPSIDLGTPARAARMLVSDELQYLWNDSTTDFKVICGSREWNVHRLVLRLHSKVFQAMCTGEFKEAQEGLVDMSAHEEVCVNGLLYYCYNFEYSTDDVANPLLFNIQLAILADQYAMPLLRRLALEKFKCQAIKAEKGHFTEAALYVFEATDVPKLFRSFILDYIIRGELLVEGSVMHERENFEEAVRACPELAKALALAFPGHGSKVT